MAKNDLITDFRALKGMISYSDPKTESRKSFPKTQKPLKSDKESEKPSEVVLKVGQKVVLMDADLRGKIISLGKTVGIELEDGLCIKVAYGEFAVTSESELKALKLTSVKSKEKTPKKKQTSHSSNAISIDLHIEAIPGGNNIPKGQQLQFQMDTFRRIIRENANRRGMKITFIHGIGDGILKAAIRKELDEVLALRCSYSIGDPAVTIVYIK